MIPTALAENCLLVEHALKGLLAKTNSHQFIWSVRTAPDLLEALNRKRPRVLILDPSICGPSTGLQLVQKLSTQYPDVRLLIYSASPDQDTAASYMFLGAAGFLPKDSPPQEVLTAIQLVSAGQHYMPPGLTRALAELQIAAARARARPLRVNSRFGKVSRRACPLPSSLRILAAAPKPPAPIARDCLKSSAFIPTPNLPVTSRTATHPSPPPNQNAPVFVQPPSPPRSPKPDLS